MTEWICGQCGVKFIDCTKACIHTLKTGHTVERVK